MRAFGDNSSLVIWAGIGRAQVRPLHNSAPALRPSQIELTGVEFKDLRWGHEGPDYFTSKRAPKRGAREIAEARVYGREAVAMIRFELIDEAGQLLAVAAAVRTLSGVDDGEYSLRVPAPAQPFRFRISGRDVGGKPFARFYLRQTEGPRHPKPGSYPHNRSDSAGSARRL